MKIYKVEAYTLLNVVNL